MERIALQDTAAPLFKQSLPFTAAFSKELQRSFQKHRNIFPFQEFPLTTIFCHCFPLNNVSHIIGHHAFIPDCLHSLMPKILHQIKSEKQVVKRYANARAFPKEEVKYFTGCALRTSNLQPAGYIWPTTQGHTAWVEPSLGGKTSIKFASH